jgi:hypothetical protein
MGMMSEQGRRRVRYCFRVRVRDMVRKGEQGRRRVRRKGRVEGWGGREDGNWRERSRFNDGGNYDIT